jgi:hypothetical protein
VPDGLFRRNQGNRVFFKSLWAKGLLKRRVRGVLLFLASHPFHPGRVTKICVLDVTDHGKRGHVLRKRPLIAIQSTNSSPSRASFRLYLDMLLRTLLLILVLEIGFDLIFAEVPSSCASCSAWGSKGGTNAVQSQHAWASKSYQELDAAQIAIFPLGSIEQHGSHLPVGTDLFLAEAFADSIAVPGVIKLPGSPFGASFEHARFPGTIAISDEPLQSMWMSVIKSVAKTGIRKVILLNAHGGQTPNAQIVARNARFQTSPPVLAVVVNLQALVHDKAA